MMPRPSAPLTLLWPPLRPALVPKLALVLLLLLVLLRSCQCRRW
jgi:hypothetical protein